MADDNIIDGSRDHGCRSAESWVWVMTTSYAISITVLVTSVSTLSLHFNTQVTELNQELEGR